MSNVSELLRVFFFERTNVGAVPPDFTVFGGHQTGNDAQQARLAAAVRAGKLEQLTGSHGKIQIAEKPAITAHAFKIDDLEYGESTPNPISSNAIIVLKFEAKSIWVALATYDTV